MGCLPPSPSLAGSFALPSQSAPLLAGLPGPSVGAGIPDGLGGGLGVGLGVGLAPSVTRDSPYYAEAWVRIYSNGLHP